MRDANAVARIRRKYRALVCEMDERRRRQWAAVEARDAGWGGVSLVARATGLSRPTILAGRRELALPAKARAVAAGRIRRAGGGRRPITTTDPALLAALTTLVDPVTRGDPESPLRWTCKSTATLAAELTRQHHPVSARTVGKLLKASGYSLQANRKTIEGKQHPDRDAQFQHIGRRVKAQQRADQPALSVDTKKKENIGKYKNPGRAWRRHRQPVQVQTHDFPDPAKGKAVPYGVYDIGQNEAWVNVGITHDTAEFAVASIRTWWSRLGRKRYRKGRLRRILITADSGGSNGPRSRLWKYELQKLADKLQVAIEVCHFPPGTSKWNKIEHRVFCHITRTWRSQPLESYQVVVELIGSTKTATGLEVHATLDEREYKKGIKVSDDDYNAINLKPHKFHGDWNYTIVPST